MYFIDPNSLVTATSASQPRTAQAHRRHRQSQPRRAASTSPTDVRKPRQHTRLWTLVPFHHAYS
jgi:hypothetical protein